jgi:hypothetical protein
MASANTRFNLIGLRKDAPPMKKTYLKQLQVESHADLHAFVNEIKRVISSWPKPVKKPEPVPATSTPYTTQLPPAPTSTSSTRSGGWINSEMPRVPRKKASPRGNDKW